MEDPEIPHEHMRKQMSGMKVLLMLLSPFSAFARKKRAELTKLQSDLNQLFAIRDDFAARYSPLGWAVFGSMSSEVMQEVLEVAPDEGEARLVKYHLDPETLRFKGQRLKSEHYRPWLDLYERAIERADAEDFLSCVPLTLLIIDGLVHRSTGRHAFSKGTDAPVFDSAASGPGGVASALSLMGAPRGGVNCSALNLPFRHGILHGADVNYGYAIVAAKAFSALHAAIDYCDRAADEAERRAHAVEQQRTPSLKETGSQLITQAKIKRSLEEWKPRQPITFERGVGPDAVGELEDESPEAAAAHFLGALTGRPNFGHIAKATVDHSKRPVGQRAKYFREHFDRVTVNSWRILGVEDKAAAVSEVAVHVWGGPNERPWSYKGKIRLINQADDGSPVVRSLEGGQWQAIEFFVTKMAAAGALGREVDDLAPSKSPR